MRQHQSLYAVYLETEAELPGVGVEGREYRIAESGKILVWRNGRYEPYGGTGGGDILKTDGDGTKFLADNGEYLPQTVSSMDRWRENQEVPLNEIAPNGKRYYGRLVRWMVAIPNGPTGFLPFYPHGLPSNAERSELLFGNSFAYIRHRVSEGVYEDMTFPLSMSGYINSGNDDQMCMYIVGSSLIPYVGGHWWGETATFSVFLKYTKTTDSPIA